MDKRFFMAYSMGKDSTLALQKMLSMGFEPVALLVACLKSEPNVTIMHHIPVKSLSRVSDSLNIPIEFVYLSEFDDWASAMRTGVKLREKYGTELLVTGDIDHSQHINRNMRFAELTNLTLFMPLSGMTREECLKEEMENGYKCIISAIADKRLPVSLLGQELTNETIETIRNCGCDACGENGEYHTLVVDSPVHRYPIRYRPKEIFHGLVDRLVYDIE